MTKQEQIAAALADVADLPIDDDEAWQNAIFRRHNSNVARAYLRLLSVRPEVAPQFSPQFWCSSQNTIGGEHEGVPCFTQCASCELEQCKRRVAELESAPGAPRSPLNTNFTGEKK